MKYYIWNMRTNTLYYCDSWEKLIYWCARYNYLTKHGKPSNALFDDPALNFNDKKVVFRWDSYRNEYVRELLPRELLIFDEKKRVIDLRLYQGEIFRCQENFHASHQKGKTEVGFRNRPVPNIRSKAKKRNKYFRNPHTMNEKRWACIPEYREYVRPKRNHKNLVSAWDDIPRHQDKSWKRQKIKRQWMKHLKN